ncbi:MAG: DUF547 domain-containing protein [Pseudomonadota bacterium]
MQVTTKGIMTITLLWLAGAASALAAPIWLERNFIPEPELVDPVFAIAKDQSRVTPDHGAWTSFLQNHLVTGEDGINRLYYGRVLENLTVLERYIKSLEGTDVTQLSGADQLAFWINLYNAATVRLIAQNYPTDSIRDVNRPWRRPVTMVNSVALSLGDIEHHIARVQFPDPRIHYAFNCAAIGCPNLAERAYAGDTLEVMLDEAAWRFVNHPRGVKIEEDGDITVSKIYGWYRDDFGGDEETALDHIREFAAPELLNALQGADDIDGYRYDWKLNDANPSD